MLEELYRYAQNHDLAARVGFKSKTVKAYVDISVNGDFLGIIENEKGYTAYAPDIGSAANGSRYCNFLVEKAKITLCIVETEKDKNIPTKHRFFLSMLDSGAAYTPQFSVLSRVLQNEQQREQIVEDLEKHKIKPTDPIGFRVDGYELERINTYFPWWNEFRQMFSTVSEDNRARCMITGEPTVPMATVPTIKGLLRVGGHTKGDAFLCYDKDAFQSYGFKQSANAPVCEEAMTAVNAALNDLLEKAPTLSGAKLVHWYAGEIPDKGDILAGVFDGFWEEEEIENADIEQDEKGALLRVKEMMKGVDEGNRPPELSARYYVLPMSGVNGRVMTRGWYEGDFNTLYQNLDQWFTDLRLVRCSGRGSTESPKLFAVFIRLLKPGGDMKKLSDRMDDELAGLSVRVLDSIMRGTPLPDEVASRCLRYIRSNIINGSDENQNKNHFDTESLVFQILKAWLLRRQRQRGDIQLMGENLQQSPHTPAYCCGRFMAIYTAIQKDAMNDVNVSVAERYYTAAGTAPAFVLGKLAQLSIYHLAKLDAEKPGIAVYYRKLLDEISVELPEKDIPKMLTMEEQTHFALGFYQQRSALYADNH